MLRGLIPAAVSIIAGTGFVSCTSHSGGPALSRHGIVNAADRRGGGIAPREIVVLYPSQAGPSRLVEWPTIFPRNTADMDYLRQRPDWGGTRVFFDNVPAPVVYSVSGEVEAIVPDGVSGRAETEVAIEYDGKRSTPFGAPVIQAAPAIFTLDSSGTGQAAMLNETGCCNSVNNPATPGSIASLYATGEGLSHAPIRVSVGKETAEIVYSGNVGMLVVNFRVPGNAPVGPSVPVFLSVGNKRSPEGVTMAIRPSERAILIVDREAAVRRHLGKSLKGSGYEVYAAGDWLQAKDYAENHFVDLLIMSQAMAEKGATEAVNAIHTRHPLMKIIVLARDDGPQFLRQADLLGVNTILPISVTDTKLLTRVQNLLRERPARY